MRKPTPPSPVMRPLRADQLTHVAGGRSGFLDSGPSDANRILERHELPGNQGS